MENNRNTEQEKEFYNLLVRITLQEIGKELRKCHEMYTVIDELRKMISELENEVRELQSNQ